MTSSGQHVASKTTHLVICAQNTLHSTMEWLYFWNITEQRISISTRQVPDNIWAADTEGRTPHLVIGGRAQGGVIHLDIPEVIHGAVGGEGLLRQEGHRLVHIAIAQLEGPLDGPHVREAHGEQEGDVLVLLLLHLPYPSSGPSAHDPQQQVHSPSPGTISTRLARPMYTPARPRHGIHDDGARGSRRKGKKRKKKEGGAREGLQQRPDQCLHLVCPPWLSTSYYRLL